MLESLQVVCRNWISSFMMDEKWKLVEKIIYIAYIRCIHLNGFLEQELQTYADEIR